MIVRSVDRLNEDRTVSAANWVSRRLLLRGDGMGFSLHDTIIHAGTSTTMRYVHHLEAVYCIEGRGSVTLVGTGEHFTIEPGTLYALDEHDEHVLRAETTMRMVCVFNPPLEGGEVHDADGAYPLPGDATPQAQP